MATIMIQLTRDEIQDLLPYRLICETMSSSVWDTIRRRRRWAEEFTEAERNACARIKRLAYHWYLVSGVPDEVTMSRSTMVLWGKLAAFCASL